MAGQADSKIESKLFKETKERLKNYSYHWANQKRIKKHIKGNELKVKKSSWDKRKAN